MFAHHPTPRLIGMAALVLAPCLWLSACSKTSTAATQVVAKVDGEEISVHQINSVLSRASGVTPANLAKAKQDILAGLVEQQLAINLAVKNKLDRSPNVVQAIEDAKREIIARAAIEQITAALPKPTDEQAQKYYTDNPALFAQRRIFNLQEISLPKALPEMPAVRDKVASAKNMEELVNWLRTQNIKFGANGGTRPAEQIPLEILPKLHEYKDGQTGLLEAKDSVMIVHLVSSKTAAVTEAQALPKIKLFLSNQRNAEEVKKQKDIMKAAAKIEYLGEFAGGEAAFKAKAEADAKAAAAAQTAAQAKAKADEEAIAKAKADEQAAAQAEAEARSKARAESRAQAASKSGVAAPSAVDLEKAIKGLK